MDDWSGIKHAASSFVQPVSNGSEASRSDDLDSYSSYKHSKHHEKSGNSSRSFIEELTKDDSLTECKADTHIIAAHSAELLPVHSPYSAQQFRAPTLPLPEMYNPNYPRTSTPTAFHTQLDEDDDILSFGSRGASINTYASFEPSSSRDTPDEIVDSPILLPDTHTYSQDTIDSFDSLPTFPFLPSPFNRFRHISDFNIPPIGLSFHHPCLYNGIDAPFVLTHSNTCISGGTAYTC